MMYCVSCPVSDDNMTQNTRKSRSDEAQSSRNMSFGLQNHWHWIPPLDNSHVWFCFVCSKQNQQAFGCDSRPGRPIVD